MTTTATEEPVEQTPEVKIDRGSFAGWIIGNSYSLLSKLAKRALVNFLATRLKEHGLDGKASEKPLTFNSQREFRVALQKLNKRFLLKAAEKDPVLLNEDMYFQRLFVTSEDSGKVLINLVNDEVTDRYVEMLQKQLVKKKIPIEFLRVSRDGISVTYSFQYRNRASTSSMDLYRIAFYIPHFLTAINTLKRKALYANPELINYSSHGITGFTGFQFTGRS